jgi:hypothetical protein
MQLNSVVVEVEVDVPRPPSIPPYKVLVSLWTLPFGIASKHALQADAHALDVVHRAPSCLVE